MNPEQPSRLNAARLRSASMTAIMVIWALFHLYVAGFGNLPFYQQRAIHVAGALTFSLLLWGYAKSKFTEARDRNDNEAASTGTLNMRRSGRLRILAQATDLALIGAVLMGTIYVYLRHETLVRSLRFNSDSERLLAAVFIIAIIIVIWRVAGAAFFILILALGAYALLGAYIPGPLRHSGVSIETFLFEIYIGRGGVFGAFTGISATIVTVFILFGILLLLGGGGNLLTALANVLGGRIRGGAAQSAVLASGFMGMINGSATANVASTGAITIPLMKRLGMERNHANGTEAVASLGGQFMPPVMGPGAFLVAELLGVSYIAVMIAALTPSVLFYVALMFALYLYASREQIGTLPASMVPRVSEVINPFAIFSFLVPIGLLLGFMISGYSTQRAGFWGSVGGLAVVLWSIARRPQAPPSAWNARNIVYSQALRLKGFWSDSRNTTVAGIANLVYVAVIIVSAQVIVALVSASGLGLTLGGMVIQVGSENLFLALFLAGVITTILSLGMPTVAAYAVGAAVCSAPLIGLGIDPMATHLFIYFMACLGAVTPPAMPVVFAAVAIGGGSIKRTSYAAMKLGFPVVILPFAFAFDEALIGVGSPVSIAMAILKAAVGIALGCIGTIGYFNGRLSGYLRVVLFASGVAVILASMAVSIAGMILGCLLLVREYRRSRQRVMARAAADTGAGAERRGTSDLY